jgi:hypothetical protein
VSCRRYSGGRGDPADRHAPQARRQTLAAMAVGIINNNNDVGAPHSLHTNNLTQHPTPLFTRCSTDRRRSSTSNGRYILILSGFFKHTRPVMAAKLRNY